MLCSICACNNTKYLSNGAVLHNKTKIKVESEQKWTDETKVLPTNIKNELYNLSVPKLNNRWLGFMKVNLWFYNKGDISKKGIKGWMARRLGEPPVLLDSINIDRTIKQFNSYLFNKGFYHNQIDYEVSQSKKRATVTYIVTPDDRYFFDEIVYPEPVDSLSKFISEMRLNSNIKSSKPFDIEMLESERNRLAEKLQENGYFGFNKKYIHFKIDSTYNDKSVNVELKILENDTDTSGIHYKYVIDNIVVNTSYANFFLSGKDSIEVSENVFYLADHDNFRPKAITDLVDFEHGDLFDKRSFISSQNNLLNLGVFKFVNISFKRKNETDAFGNRLLDVNIKLNPAKKYQFSGELEANNRQNVLVGDNFIGTALSAFIINKNTFKGGENLSFNMNGGVEFDLRRQNELINTSSLNFQWSLAFPKFLLPFKTKFKQSYYNPKTKITLSNSLINRTNDYRINATELAMDYNWQKPNGASHLLSPVSISFFNVLNVSESFQQNLEQSKRLQRSFEENIILGASYGAVVTNNFKHKKNIFYYRPRVEIGGNVLNLFDRINPEKQLKLNGVNYAQYIKLDSDLRFYFEVDETRIVAVRLLGGLAVPYSNSSVLPYVKQYFAGGTTGVRAFRIRGIGPGSFSPEADSNFDDSFDRTGDMRLEANIEYRFPIYSYFKGALFLDAGNVWTLKEDIDKPGSQFEAKDFWKEIAMGIGFGARLDFTYFILRLDTSMPIYRPDRPLEDRWVTDQISLGDRAWRRDNINLSLGIGYPF